MDRISFTELTTDEGQPTIAIEINGERLEQLVLAVELPNARSEGHDSIAGGYTPITTWAIKDPPAQHFIGAESSHLFCGPQEKTVLCICECGEPGCWPLMARVAATEKEVHWTDFEQPHRQGRWTYEGFEFRFDRGQFEAALAELPEAECS